jgi:hypothetical protein
VRRFRPELWQQKAWLLRHNATSFFIREFLDKNMTVILHPPYFSPFSRLKMKLKSSHFDTSEVIQAESQAMLITLAEHDFQDGIKE